MKRKKVSWDRLLAFVGLAAGDGEAGTDGGAKALPAGSGAEKGFSNPSPPPPPPPPVLPAVACTLGSCCCRREGIKREGERISNGVGGLLACAKGTSRSNNRKIELEPYLRAH